MDNGTDQKLDGSIASDTETTNDNSGTSGSIGDGIATLDPNTVKRGRGRPRKSESGSGSASGATREGKSGTGQAKRQTEKTPNAVKSGTIDVVGLEKILYSLHAMASAAIIPELALTEGEARELAEAVAGVNQFYSTVVDPKLLAWVGVITVAGKIYAPRFIAAGLRRSMENRAKAKSVAPVQGVVNPPQSQQNTAKPTPIMEQVFTRPDFVSVPSE